MLERRAAVLLRPGGAVGTEHADAQGAGAPDGGAPAVFLRTGRWTDVRDHRDLTGRDRFTTARAMTGTMADVHEGAGVAW